MTQIICKIGNDTIKEIVGNSKLVYAENGHRIAQKLTATIGKYVDNYDLDVVVEYSANTIGVEMPEAGRSGLTTALNLSIMQIGNLVQENVYIH